MWMHELWRKLSDLILLMLCTFLVINLDSWATAAKSKRPDITSSGEYRLMKYLLKDYNPQVRPRYNSSEVVNIGVRFSLQQIYDLDEKRQILTISGWLTAEWTDDFLEWNPEEFGGVDTLIISPKKIWTPKMAIGNSATRMFHEWKHFWITVRNNGQCRWQPGGNFAFTCALDMNFYPFDEQSCTMEIETWFYTADKVQLTNTMDKFGLETFLRHGEWTVVGTEVTQIDRVYGYYQSEAFPELYFTIHLQRKYTFYFMYILLPCIMLSFVLLMVFLLPAESGEKISLGVSILVAFSLFLLIVAEQVPDTSDAVPVIAIYLMYFMMATALSVMTSTLVLKLHHRGLESRPPKWLRSLMLDFFPPILCLGSITRWRKQFKKCDGYGTSGNKDETETLITRSKTTVHSNGQCQHSTKANGLNVIQNLSAEDADTLSRTLSLECLRPERSTVKSRKLTRKSRLGTRSSTSGSKHTNTSATSDNDDSFGDVLRKEEWKKISQVLDRLFFWLFLFFILIPLFTLIGFIRVFKAKNDEIGL